MSASTVFTRGVAVAATALTALLGHSTAARGGLPARPLEARASERVGSGAIPRLLIREDLVVRAGDSVELCWTLPGSEIEELEILLSLDDGRRFPLRVSPEIEAGGGRYLWHIPPGLIGRGRLRLRYNWRGREIAGDPTAAFAILPGAPREAATGLVLEGDWWRGARTLDAPGSAAAFSPPAQNLGPGSDLPPAGIASDGAGVNHPSRVLARPLRPRIAVSAPSAAPGITAPRSTPLRN